MTAKKVRIEYLDGTFEIVSRKKWDELRQDKEWLDQYVAIADVVE